MRSRGCSPPTGHVYYGVPVRIQFHPKCSSAHVTEGLLCAGPWEYSREFALGPARVPTVDPSPVRNAVASGGLGWGGQLVKASLWPDPHLKVCVCILHSSPGDPLLLGLKLAVVSDAQENRKRAGLLPRVNGRACPGRCFFLSLSPSQHEAAGAWPCPVPGTWKASGVHRKLYSFIPATNNYGEPTHRSGFLALGQQQ